MRLLLFAFLILTACTHGPVKNPNGVEGVSPGEYNRIVKNHTQGSNQYSGFYQTFQADVTMLTTEMQTASLRQRAAFLQWDNTQYQQEREKLLQENSAYAKFFLRFFVPEKDYDDLHKGKPIWKIYLDYGGNRFEGKAKKLTDKFVELATVYPHLDRFSTPYEITFNVPMSTIEQGSCKVILTSSLGSAEFSFPVGK